MIYYIVNHYAGFSNILKFDGEFSWIQIDENSPEYQNFLIWQESNMVSELTLLEAFNLTNGIKEK